MIANEFIGKLTIDSVNFLYPLTKNQEYINFSINEKDFYLTIEKKENYWFPKSVRHEFNGKSANLPCPLCGNESDLGAICVSFNKHLNELFKRLLNFPPIRVRAITEGIVIKYENK